MKLIFDMETIEFDDITKLIEFAKGYHFELKSLDDDVLALVISKGEHAISENP